MTAEVLPLRRGRPSAADLTQRLAISRERNALLSAENRAMKAEAREDWGRVIHLAGRGHLSVVAERPDLSLHTFGEIRSIASRRLRQIGDTDDAA